MRVPAVVGSWPEPFLQASAAEDRLPVRVECAGAPAPCDTVTERLSDEGVTVSEGRLGRSAEGDAVRVLVGQWPEIEGDAAAAQIADGPASSGVFARFAGAGAEVLLALDVQAGVASRLGDGAGLVAAVRDGERPPTWVVTGVDDSGVRAAAEALAEPVLRDRYAVVVGAGSDRALPVPVVEAP
jgi:hypothetical protein